MPKQAQKQDDKLGESAADVMFTSISDDNEETSSSKSSYFILKTIYTDMKPTCMVQLSRRHLAVATGFLNDKSKVEIINLFSGQIENSLEHHSDMIDSILLLDLSKYTQAKIRCFGSERHSKLKRDLLDNRFEYLNPFVRWLVTIGRDNKIVIWKLFDGRVMYRDNIVIDQFKNRLQPKPKEDSLKRFQERNSLSQLVCESQLVHTERQQAYVAIMSEHTDFVRSFIHLEQKQFLKQEVAKK